MMRARGGRRRSLRPYGATARAFNAMRSFVAAPVPPPMASHSSADAAPSFSSRSGGEGRGERRATILRIRSILIAAVIGLVIESASAAARPAVILDFGDSLTAGLGLPAKQAFPAQLEAWLHQQGIEARVINAGVSGDTTAGGLARLDWALAEKPDLVILALGANDALRGIEPSTVRDNLDKMIGMIEASGAKLLLLGMLAPSNWGEEYKNAFDRIFPELAHNHHLPLYPFFLEGVAMKPELNQPDGLHPNEHGVAVLVDRIAPMVARILGGAS
jgi:acyl-CoA thioesterase-1